MSQAVDGSVPDPDPVRVEREEATAVLVLNRPRALNAVNDQMREHLVAALEELASDDSVRAVVLTGEGRGFCAGGDIKAMQERLGTPADEIAFDGWKRMHEISRAVTKLHELGKVTIAAVNGPAAGLGCDLALCCDFVVASRDAMFAMSYVRRGLVPDGGGLYFLPRRVGLAKAKELIFTGRQVLAEEALQIGIADRLVSPEELIGEAKRLAAEIAGASPVALALSKSILDRTFELDLSEVFALGTSAQGVCFTSKDHHEAVAAFLESRRRD